MQQSPPPNPSPLPSNRTKHQRQRQLVKPHSASTSASTTTNSDAALLSLLRQHKTEEAYRLYSLSFSSPNHLPSPTCLSRLVAQLSYRRDSPSSLHRARSIVRRLRDLRQLHRLDSNSLGLLASASSSSPHLLPFALSLLRSLLLSHYLPHRLSYTPVISRLSNSPDENSPRDALQLFDSILLRLRQLPHPSLSSDTRPDTAAFNAALNAAANVPDLARFVTLFHDMRHFNVHPDVLTFNVAIKMCARAGRRDLLPSVLHSILRRGIPPCPTTMHSLVAAYVGFGDVHAAERVVHCLRDGRLDLCAQLTALEDDAAAAANSQFLITEESRLLEVLFQPDDAPPPLLPKKYPPDTRMYTILMKGYMKEGRVHDVMLMKRAMQREPDPASRPDHVTYTTVISALVDAGELGRAHGVLAEMIEAKVPPNRITYNILLKGYCRQLQLDNAKELVEEMASQAGVEPNVVTYNTLIDGCILNDDSAGALKYFNEMRERGIAPSKVSYTTLMKAFALSGQPRLAHKVFDEMTKDSRVKVDRVAWNMLVEGYCRLGLLEESKKIVERMKEAGFEPDVATYGSLANGIAMARKPGEALLLWTEVKERCAGGLRPDEGLLDTLADICVRAAFFKKALEIVACMEENGIPPNKTKYKRIYVEMHSRMFTSKHASMARQQRRSERKRAAEAFKFWLGLPNSYYEIEWRIEPMYGDHDGES